MHRAPQRRGVYDGKVRGYKASYTWSVTVTHFSRFSGCIGRCVYRTIPVSDPHPPHRPALAFPAVFDSIPDFCIRSNVLLAHVLPASGEVGRLGRSCSRPASRASLPLQAAVVLLPSLPIPPLLVSQVNKRVTGSSRWPSSFANSSTGNKETKERHRAQPGRFLLDSVSPIFPSLP
jgi:hypothetical protein